MSHTNKATRKKMLLRLAGAVATVFVVLVLWQFFIGSRRVVTDNAYVGADVADITPLVPGNVIKVSAIETAPVKAGDVLVELDPRDYQIKVQIAQANLDQARRKIDQARSTSDSLRAMVDARKANYETARADLARTTQLHARGNASAQQLQHDQDVASSAQAALLAAEAELVGNQAVAGEGPVDDQPSVKLAAASLAQAQLDLTRTKLTAPIDGIIAKRNVQVGGYVQPGAALMAVVPVDALYVDANFKESQLSKVQIGQEAELVSDLYGKHAVFHGRVVGLGGGTGSAFALIPAQNATANWIKVVQRLPIRISLDPAELKEHPLRVGLSLEATVDISSKP